MNYPMIKHLVLKDWYLQRWAIAGAILAGLVSVAVLAAGGAWAVYAGTTLVITVLIAIGAQLAMSTVLYERKEQTLSFVMSLPISARDYTAAKLVANLLMFLVPWIALFIAAVAVLASSPALSAGLIPFASILMTEILASTTLILGVALVSESQNWTIAAILVGNLAINAVLFYAAHIPRIAHDMAGRHAVWSAPVFGLLLAELAVIVFVLGITFFLQSRKRDFV